MSNCIRFTDATKTVTFPADAIDGGKLMTLIKEHEGHRDYDGIHGADYTDTRGDCVMVYWFLNSNVKYHHGAITVVFGEARSGHTWRDFQGTIGVINKFLKREVKHWFTIADESDGFRTWQSSCVTFKPNHSGQLLSDAQKEKIRQEVAASGPPKRVTSLTSEGLKVEEWDEEQKKYVVTSFTARNSRPLPPAPVQPLTPDYFAR